MMQPLLVHRKASPSFWILASSAAFVLVTVILLAPTESVLSRGALVIVAAVGPFLAAIDWKEHRLPDRLLLPANTGVLAVLLISALTEQQWGRFGVALLCALGVSAFFMVLFVIAPDQMGFGDVKLMILLGLMLGWQGPFHVLAGVVLGLISGLVFGLSQMVLRMASRKSHLALGPHLIFGALLVGIFSV